MLLAVYVIVSAVATMFVPLLGNIFDPLYHASGTTDKIAALGVFVGLCTISLVIGQVIIALVEVLLVRNQGEILKRQDAELARKARLVVRGLYTAANRGDMKGGLMRLWILNIGNRTAHGVTVLFAVSDELMPNDEQMASWSGGGTDIIDSTTVAVYSRDYMTRLFFPAAPIVIYSDHLFVRTYGDGPPPPIYWRLLYEDGAMPGVESWNKLTPSFQDDKGRIDPPWLPAKPADSTERGKP